MPKTQWLRIYANRRRPKRSQMGKRGNEMENPKRTRKLEKMKRGDVKMRGIERGKRGRDENRNQRP
jgi:hypothetical protein